MCWCAAGFFVPFTYLPAYGIKWGLSDGESAFLLSIIGIFNTAARPVFGWLAGRPWADSLTMYNALCLVGGTGTMMASHMHTHALLAIYAGIFGMFVGKKGHALKG